MRAQAGENSVSVRAYAGTTGVLLGMNVEPGSRPGLLGFALERLSKSASEGNDENFLIVHGNTDVADCYGCELMRLYDHYRFR